VEAWNSDLQYLLEQWRAENQVIVFTNGCFDLLHPGHIDNLIQAKAYGDILIVGINSDRSVKSLKGGNRPILSANDRLSMLLALKSVDYALVFDEDTPERLITEIMPDVLVKGNEYGIENIVGAKSVLQNGGRVELIKREQKHSTSELIERIKTIK